MAQLFVNILKRQPEEDGQLVVCVPSPQLAPRGVGNDSRMGKRTAGPFGSSLGVVLNTDWCLLREEEPVCSTDVINMQKRLCRKASRHKWFHRILWLGHEGIRRKQISSFFFTSFVGGVDWWLGS